MGGFLIVWRWTVAGFNADGPGLLETLDAAGLAPFLRNLVADAWATVRAEPLGFAALVAVLTLIGRQLAARHGEGPPPEG